MTLGRVEVDGGALIVGALLFYLDRSGIFGAAVLAMLLHELGHLWAIHALGGRVAVLRLSWAGAEMRLSAARPLPPPKLLLCCLAGPGTNLLLWAVCVLLARHGAGEKLYLFAGLHLGLALFNLLPIRWLDGGRALESLLAALGRPEGGRRITAWAAAVLAILLLVGGLYLLWGSGGRNFTVLLAGLWVAMLAFRDEKVKKR